MEQLKKIWFLLGESGIQQNPDEEELLIRPLNYVILLSFLLTLLFDLYAFATGDWIYGLLLSSVVFNYVLQFLLIRTGNLYLAKWFMCFTPATAAYICWVLVGGYFGQGMITLCSIIIAELLFRKQRKIKLFLLFYNVIGFCVAATWAASFSPLFGTQDIFLDELMVFILVVLWIWIAYNFYKTNMEKLVASLEEKNTVLELTASELEGFTSLASHDLKAPLRNIATFLQLMERNLSRQEYVDLKENLQLASASTKQMQQLLSDLRELSRIQVGKKNRQKLHNFNTLITKASDNLYQQIQQKNVQLNIADLPSFICNEIEFLLLFQNLIQNGIKYNTSPQPQIKIWAEEYGQLIKLFFKDNGIGIEEKYHQQIFKFFRRLHTTQEYEGTGMGLGLCTRIVQKYNGKISVLSALGSGSTFIIELPIVTELEPAAILT